MVTTALFQGDRLIDQLEGVSCARRFLIHLELFVLTLGE